jgi:lysophospholipase L1-like esterase
MIEGVNDIDAATSPRGPVITATDLINAYKTLVGQAHAVGVKVIFGTLTPFGDASGWSPAGQQIHDDVNAWIRGGTANGFDGFVDFEKATQDPAQPTKYRAGFDSGDGLHPSHQGKQAMAAAIPLTLFN